MANTLPQEQRSAARILNDPRVRGRTFFGPAGGPRELPYDWTDDLGRTYDAVGADVNTNRQNMNQLINAIDRHLHEGDKALNITVIDMTNYSPAQIAQVRGYLETLSAADHAKIIRVGF
jgi:hypothetical protein